MPLIFAFDLKAISRYFVPVRPQKCGVAPNIKSDAIFIPQRQNTKKLPGPTKFLPLSRLVARQQRIQNVLCVPQEHLGVLLVKDGIVQPCIASAEGALKNDNLTPFPHSDHL